MLGAVPGSSAKPTVAPASAVTGTFQASAVTTMQTTTQAAPQYKPLFRAPSKPSGPPTTFPVNGPFGQFAANGSMPFASSSNYTSSSPSIFVNGTIPPGTTTNANNTGLFSKSPLSTQTFTTPPGTTMLFGSASSTPGVNDNQPKFAFDAATPPSRK